MNFVFLLVAFLGTFLASRRSPGWGLLAMFGVGYFNGVVRANFLNVFTTFMYDAAVLALYLEVFFGRSRRTSGVRSGAAERFVLLLIAWPVLLSFVPVNNLLVQWVALRGTVWLLPVLLVATRLTAADLTVITRGLVVLNLLALAGGTYVYMYGVEALYPKNAVTQIIYASRDVAGYKHYRVPSTFLNAHSYGGTMLSTLPFLLDRVAGVGVRMTERWLTVVGVIAAVGGMLMCGARSPFILFAVALAIAWILTRFSLTVGLVGVLLFGGGLILAGTDERLQRASSLGDTEFVTNRIAGSANASFLELLVDYPMGAGMGSSIGTSIPFFLSHVAPQPIGLENEFSRILIDQGWVGLGGWLSFVGWLFARPPKVRPRGPWRLGVVFMYSLSLSSWMTAFIGTGMLSSVPGTALLLTQMGVLVAVRVPGVVPGVVGRKPQGLAEVRR